MDLFDFCKKRPFLYHLTDRSNLPFILNSKILLSTTAIATLTLSKDDAREFIRSKRNDHVTLSSKEVNYKIRDQQPISVKVLDRSLSDDLTAMDFIELLNNRVFWWPTLSRLNSHYNRYASEHTIILKVITNELLVLNKNVELCHLNSGATRCHPAYGGNAPTRGKDSFLNFKMYNRSIASVAEVTFIGKCVLPENIWTSASPTGKWKLIT